jgi:hypothetical protein
MMDEQKRCSCCGKWKILSADFYCSKGVFRAECKVCTIRRNTKYQKVNKSWLGRSLNKEERKRYMRDYYMKNVKNYKEYREKFVRNNPDYYRKYYKNSMKKRNIQDD